MGEATQLELLAIAIYNSDVVANPAFWRSSWLELSPEKREKWREKARVLIREIR